jgi:STE24 endopeptidase
MTQILPELDPDRQERARQYARIRRRLWALNLLLNTLYLALWVSKDWATAVLRALNSGGFSDILGPDPAWAFEILAVSFAVGAPWFLLSAPLSFYSSYSLPHRFGLSTQRLREWFIDALKSAVLALAMGVPLLLGLYLLLRQFPTTWWLWTAAGYTLFTVVLTALAPVLLMPIFYKFRPLEDEHQDLVKKLLTLTQKADTFVRGVYTFDMSRRTRAANAALVGIGRTRRVILGDTLLSEFDSDEIETVLAHELGHHIQKDIPLSIVAQGLFNFAAFYLAHQGMTRLASQFDWSDIADPTGLPLLMLLLGLISFLAMPIINAYSRWRESLADNFALEITGNPSSFASALTRLANQNLAEVNPERWVVYLLHSHPPLQSRILKAQVYGQDST